MVVLCIVVECTGIFADQLMVRNSIIQLPYFSFLPCIVSPFNSFCGNYLIYEVKNCHNAETV